MVRVEDTTELTAPCFPAGENELSRRYLRVIEKWIPVGTSYFNLWSDRPNCGHFFGGCHAYGLETMMPAEAITLASVSPEFNEKVAGISREEVQRMAIQAVRYLCFTHDTGPEDCVRPEKGLGNDKHCGTKWGERGLGFFRESQCGHTVAGLARICLLLRDQVDEETWLMVGRVLEDYAGRFGKMPPKSGVYWDTQMEENGWTVNGLTSCFLFLSRHAEVATWEATCRKWMFSTCSAPQDANDFGMIGDVTVKQRASRTFTALPDYWAENHGMVHPNYTTSGLRCLMNAASQLALWGRALPPELFWNRKRVYENLKAVTDGSGYPSPVQGMDWHYLPTVGSEVAHTIASVFFDDPDAAALALRGLRNSELRQDGNDGRMYEKEFAEKAHDQQDPMIIREGTIWAVGHGYLLHRLFGPGPKPTPEPVLEKRLAGVRSYPHAGFVHHRHVNGQTSFSWRNSVMALPLPKAGTYTIAPCSDSWMGRPVVRDRPDSHRLKNMNVAEYDDAFAAAMVMDRCQESLRQQVLFASLPDGRVLSFARFVALETLMLESLEQGFLRVTNESFPLIGHDCRGARVLYHPDGKNEYKGWLGEKETDDVIDHLGKPAWVNVDDRMGIVFVGEGEVVYHNRHYYKPYRAIADDLTLSRQEDAVVLQAGEAAGRMTALIVPEQSHRETAAAVLRILDGLENSAALATEGYLVAANFEEGKRICEFEWARSGEISIYAGATVEMNGDRVRCSIPLEGESACLLEETHTLRAKGHLFVDAIQNGSVYVTNLDREPMQIVLVDQEGGVQEQEVEAGKVVRF